MCAHPEFGDRIAIGGPTEERGDCGERSPFVGFGDIGEEVHQSVLLQQAEEIVAVTAFGQTAGPIGELVVG